MLSSIKRILLPVVGMAVSIAPQALPAQLSANAVVVASGIQAPRGLRFGPDGDLYVGEAGTGGTTSTDGQCPAGDTAGGTVSWRAQRPDLEVRSELEPHHCSEWTAFIGGCAGRPTGRRRSSIYEWNAVRADCRRRLLAWQCHDARRRNWRLTPPTEPFAMWVISAPSCMRIRCSIRIPMTLSRTERRTPWSARIMRCT